jgi:hypothetical protein
LELVVRLLIGRSNFWLVVRKIFFAMHPPQRAIEVLPNLLERQRERGAPSDQHIIMSRLETVFATQAYNLAQASADAIAFNGIADFPRDSKSDPRRAWFGAAPGLQHEARRRDPGSGCGFQKIRPLPQSLHRDEAGTGPPRIQALRRLRPRERRAATTLRPALVAIRARKPWRRLRTILLG